eukprot:gene976-4220_t
MASDYQDASISSRKTNTNHGEEPTLSSSHVQHKRRNSMPSLQCEEGDAVQFLCNSYNGRAVFDNQDEINHAGSDRSHTSSTRDEAHSVMRSGSVAVQPIEFAFSEIERHLLDENCVVSRVLVINTGGTIGMKRTPDGFAPYPNFLEEYVRCTPLLNDETYVRMYPEYCNGCITPATSLALHESFSRRVYYEFLECEPLLDSSNMDMADWVKIATMIKENYHKFQGFVILHGTDTMSYTASALSFMLENLGKSVVVTGAQAYVQPSSDLQWKFSRCIRLDADILVVLLAFSRSMISVLVKYRPMSENLSDGYSNFMGALTVAGYFLIPEVTILFSSKVYRGNRTTKMTTFSLDAFDSPNFPALMELGAGVHLRKDLLFTPSTLAKFRVHTDLNPNVSIMRLFPGITANTVKSFLQEPTQGVVIQSYGSGNGPDTRTDIWELFKNAIKRGIILINCTQCSHGTVTDSYKAGRALSNVGIIPGADMTPESALTKLCYVLSMKNKTYLEKCAIMRQNLRGELTIDPEHADEPTLDPALVALESSLYPVLMCNAAAEGDIERICELKDKGISLFIHDYDMRTPIHLACAEGHLETVKFLLENGCSVHSVDRFGRTPLMDAILNTQLDIINLLIRTGATLEMTDVEVGTVLCRLTAQEKFAEIAAWIAAEADCNCRDYNGQTALHLAAKFGFARILETLVINGGADINIEDEEGRKPIQ